MKHEPATITRGGATMKSDIGPIVITLPDEKKVALKDFWTLVLERRAREEGVMNSKPTPPKPPKGK